MAKKVGQTASTGKQQSILGFFSKSGGGGIASSPAPSSAERKVASSPCLQETTRSNSMATTKRSVNLTPLPSSDAIEPGSSQENRHPSDIKVCPRESTSASYLTLAKMILQPATGVTASSPSRKVSPSILWQLSTLSGTSANTTLQSQKAKKEVNYAESSGEEDEDVFVSLRANRTRQRRPRTTVPDDDEDDYQAPEEGQKDDDDDNEG